MAAETEFRETTNTWRPGCLPSRAKLKLTAEGLAEKYRRPSFRALILRQESVLALVLIQEGFFARFRMTAEQLFPEALKPTLLDTLRTLNDILALALQGRASADGYGPMGVVLG